MSKLVTSGTGHDRCPSPARAHQAPGHHRMVATKKLGKPVLVSREPQKIFGAFFARQANSRAPAGVKVTKVPDSCILSQPRSIASLRPAPYSAGLPRSRNRNDSLIFSMWMRPELARSHWRFRGFGARLFPVGIGAGGGVFHECPMRTHGKPAVHWRRVAATLTNESVHYI